MDTLTTLINIALIWTIAAVTPGPNFVLTAQTATGYSRRLGGRGRRNRHYNARPGAGEVRWFQCAICSQTMPISALKMDAAPRMRL